MTAEIRTIDGGQIRICPGCGTHVYSFVPVGRLPGWDALCAKAGVDSEYCTECVVKKIGESV